VNHCLYEEHALVVHSCTSWAGSLESLNLNDNVFALVSSDLQAAAPAVVEQALRHAYQDLLCGMVHLRDSSLASWD
jgi:hypothetical protein